MTSKKNYSIREYTQRVYWANTTWKISVQQDGVRKTFYCSIEGAVGRKECAKKAIAWLSGNVPFAFDTRTAVDKIYPMFLEKKETQTTNIRTIKSRYENHIKPVIGKKKIRALTSGDLQDVLDIAYSKHNLSRKTLINLRGDLSEFCRYLRKNDIRDDLRIDDVTINPNARKSEKRTLSVKEIAILFSATETVLFHNEVNDDLLNAYRLQVAIGLRPGELLGLEWCDVNDEYIEIKRAINDAHKETRGKNDNAHRVIPQTRYTREIMANQEKYRDPTGDPTQRIFGDIGQLCYRERWGRFCLHNGIKYITPYELRHTFASINKHLPQWLLDCVMGHAHQGMSLGVYAHELDGDFDALAELLDKNLDRVIERGNRML